MLLATVAWLTGVAEAVAKMETAEEDMAEDEIKELGEGLNEAKLEIGELEATEEPGVELAIGELGKAADDDEPAGELEVFIEDAEGEVKNVQGDEIEGETVSIGVVTMTLVSAGKAIVKVVKE